MRFAWIEHPHGLTSQFSLRSHSFDGKTRLLFRSRRAFERPNDSVIVDALCRKMNAIAIVFCILIVGSCATPAQAQESSTDAEATIKAVVSTIVKEHLTKPAIDDNFCRQWFDNYLDSIDPMRLYFLDSDVSEFQTRISQLPELVTTGNPEFCRSVSSRYQSRVESALVHVIQTLDDRFDFSINEQKRIFYDNWPKTIEERNERWRLQLKHDLLLEKSAGSDQVAAVQFLRSRYQSIRQQAKQMSDERAIGIFMDSFCRTVDPHSGYLIQNEFNSFMGGLLKEYSIGLYTDHRSGRTIIRGLGTEFRRESTADSIIGCELLAIRTRSGAIHNVREIYPSTIGQLIRFGLERDSLVTLELYDEARQRRFAVNWPRK